MRKKIGECLIQAGLISEEDLQVALTEHKKSGERVGTVLVRLNLATEKQITKALAYQLGFPYASLSDEPPDPAAITLIPKEVALKRVCVAVGLEKNLLTVAMSDPLLFSLVQDLEFQTGYRIKQVVATRTDILESIETGYPDKALAKYTGGSGGLSVPASQQKGAGKAGESGAGSGLVPRRRQRLRAAADGLARRARRQRLRTDHRPRRSGRQQRDHQRASDIHIERPRRRARPPSAGRHPQRSDGPAQVGPRRARRPHEDHGGDGHRGKAPAAGRPHPHQDGRRQDVDFRVSSLRTLFGEKIVMRVLDSRKGRRRSRSSGSPPRRWKSSASSSSTSTA